jgi:hypothetical protein
MIGIDPTHTEREICRLGMCQLIEDNNVIGINCNYQNCAGGLMENLRCANTIRVQITLSEPVS